MISYGALGRFIQIFDSSFPSGSFAHSYGLEAHILKNIVRNSEELFVFLKNKLYYEYINIEYVVAKRVFEYLKSNNIKMLLKEDKNFGAYFSYEYAKASKDVGANYLKHIDFDIKNSIIKEYFLMIKEKKAVGNELIVLSSYAYELGIDLKTFLLLWTKQSFVNIATTSLKISRIKPFEVQKVLFSFDELIEKAIDKKRTSINNFNPYFEEIIYSHLVLEPKMFTT